RRASSRSRAGSMHCARAACAPRSRASWNSRRRVLRFRADRLEDPLEGGELWIDFKTSRRPLSDAVKLDTREDHMRKAIGEAKALQVAAYALARGPEAIGRYVFLHPLIEAERRAQDASGADPEVRRLFFEAAARLYEALEE